MRSKNYFLTENALKMVGGEAIRKYFNCIRFEELCQENSADRSYHKYLAEDIYGEYSKLDTKELAHLIEYRAISLLEEILWGHRFEAKVIVNSTNIADCCDIYVSLSILRERI